MTWQFSSDLNDDGYGYFSIWMWSGTHEHVEVTWFRNIPTLIQSMEFVDPFGDAVASIEFPQCSGYDSGSGDTWFLNENINVDIYWVPCTRVDNGDENRVLDPVSNEYGTMWAHPDDAQVVYEGYTQTIEPSSTSVSVTCQGCLWQVDRFFAKPMFPLRPKTIEEMIGRYFDPKRRGLFTQPLKIDWDGTWSGITPGAHYPREYTNADYLKFLKKDSVLQRFVPTNLQPSYQVFDPGIPGYVQYPTYWTGYLTRYTGGWDKALTSYVASQLSYMYYKVPAGNDPETTGLTEGDSWTIGKAPGRVPIMYLKRQARTPDLVAYYGQPGVELQLSRDGTQSTNVIFGRGKGNDGSQWLVQNFPQNAPWSAWRPIGWDRTVGEPDLGPDGESVGIYHWDDPNWTQEMRENLYDGYDWYELQSGNIWIQEKNWANIPNGIEQNDASDIAEMYIARDKDPGWIGSATLQVDLRNMGGDPVSRWTIRPGMVLLVKGFRGYNTPVVGTNVFHIARVEMRPQDLTVSLTLDTKFREIVSIEEARQSTRDSLAPMKMLQVGRESALIEDLAMAWNINQGAGCFPKGSIDMPKETAFPYCYVAGKDTLDPDYQPKNIFKDKYINGSISSIDEIVTTNEGPSEKGSLASTIKSSQQDKQFYVPVYLGGNQNSLHWAFQPLLLSQAFTIARTEFACYDKDGNLAPVEFHVSLFRSYRFDVKGMPNPAAEFADAEIINKKDIINDYAALWDGAFEKIDPATGQPWDWGPTLRYQYHLPADNSQWFMGWGTFERPAGFSPGAKNRGDKPTGMLMDGATWGFDFNSSAEFAADQNQKESAGVHSASFTGGVAIYAQYSDADTSNFRDNNDWVYVMGRMYRQPQTGA